MAPGFGYRTPQPYPSSAARRLIGFCSAADEPPARYRHSAAVSSDSQPRAADAAAGLTAMPFAAGSSCSALYWASQRCTLERSTRQRRAASAIECPSGPTSSASSRRYFRASRAAASAAASRLRSASSKPHPRRWIRASHAPQEHPRLSRCKTYGPPHAFSEGQFLR